MKQVRFAVTGIVGFAKTHLSALQRLEKRDGRIKLWGVIARDPSEDPEVVEMLKASGIRLFHDFDAFLSEAKGSCDVVTLPTSIPSHAPLSIKAMQAGFHVLTEKPPAATIQDIDAMIRTSEATGRTCAVGFQNMYNPAIQQIKERLVTGEYGKIISMACTATWPREDQYYARNPWAGRLVVNGELVLDGPMNNALAHYLHLMLYLAGDTHAEAADVRSVRAELYRARPGIESDDTGCLQLQTTSGIGIHFNVTHCATETFGPVIEVVTERATISWDREGAVIQQSTGEETHFTTKGSDLHGLLFTDFVDSLLDERKPLSRIDVARSFTLTINGAHVSSGGIHPIPDAFKRHAETRKGHVIEIEGIRAIGDQAFRQRKLFSELNVPWAVATESVSLENFTQFTLPG